MTYRPLCREKAGRQAIDRFGLPPYIDGSCRREPDFQSVFPTITALCRAGKFAPRLRIGDRIAYITKLGDYDQNGELHWRLTALLRVSFRFTSHEAAAGWFSSKGLRTPGNCIVDGNEPQPLDHTDGKVPDKLKHRLSDFGAERIIRLWDRGYQDRAKNFSVVLACESFFLELGTPPRISRRDWHAWIGKIPITRTPPVIDEALWQQLEILARSTPD